MDTPKRIPITPSDTHYGHTQEDTHYTEWYPYPEFSEPIQEFTHYTEGPCFPHKQIGHWVIPLTLNDTHYPEFYSIGFGWERTVVWQSFSISYWDVLKFPFSVDTTERGDREWKQAQRQGDFLDNSSTQKTKEGPKPVLSPKGVTALRPLKDRHQFFYIVKLVCKPILQAKWSGFFAFGA